jgi:hypothetical protein
MFIGARARSLRAYRGDYKTVTENCFLLEIGPNLSSFLVQLLVLAGAVAAAYRGQSIIWQHANRPPKLEEPS